MRLLLTILLLLLAVSLADAQQLMRADKLAAVRDSLPTLSDDIRNEQLHSDRMMWFGEDEIPPAFQKEIGNGYAPSYFHSAFRNSSGDISDAPLGHGRFGGGHANTDFPWTVRPGGAHISPNVDSIKGQLVPAGKHIAVFNRLLWGPFYEGSGRRLITGGGSPRYIGDKGSTGSDGIPVMTWLHPEGTVYVELLFQQIASQKVLFEIRFRERAKDDWEVDIFRPYPTVQSLIEGLQAIGGNDSLIAYLQTDRVLQEERLADDNHPDERGFEVYSEVYPLPPLARPAQDALALLDKETWESALGETFAGECPAPTNDNDTPHIVPQYYKGSFVGNSQIGCTECHQHTNAHSNRFDDQRGWYGRIRGSDGIFHWHPIEPRTIGGPPALRDAFVRSGLIKWYDGPEFPAGFTAIEGVD